VSVHGRAGKTLSHATIAELLGRLAKAGIDFIKTEQLCTFNGEPGHSLGQGQLTGASRRRRSGVAGRHRPNSTTGQQQDSNL